MSSSNSSSSASASQDHKVKLRPYSRLMHWYRWNDVYLPGFNQAARTALKMKQWKDDRDNKAFIADKQEAMASWFKDTPLFFGFSSPRSGTVFLTDLLTRTLEGGIVEHEANIVDYLEFTRAIQSEENAFRYIIDFRKADIFKRAEGQPTAFYGEVNPFLRMHCKAIAKAMPNAKLLHIVRDGKEVVRSVMCRDKLGKKDPMSDLIFPPANDPYAAEWGNMDRFEKVCWQWQFTNRYMRENIAHTVYFKRMRTDYDYFKTQVADHIEQIVPQEAWEDHVNRPKNQSVNYRFPHWKEWTDEQMATFERICGEEMKNYNFS